jgi:hypothetical protein
VVGEICEAKETPVDEEIAKEDGPEDDGRVGGPKCVDATDDGAGDWRSIHERR